MISPPGMRGKGIGSPDRPAVPVVPRPREPLDRLATKAAPCSSRPLDRVLKSPPGVGHMPRIGPIWLAVRGCATRPLGPYGLLGRFGVLRGKAGGPPLDTPRHPWTGRSVSAPHLPEGPKGEGVCRGQHFRNGELQLEWELPS
jgi:hypothetical protein